LSGQSGSSTANGDATSSTNSSSLSQGNLNTGLETQTQNGNGRAKVSLKPKEVRLVRAHPFDGDLRDLPYTKPVEKDRPEREPPEIIPIPYPTGAGKQSSAPTGASASVAERSAPAPAPLTTFEGLDNVNWGAGHPPDTNGDVGPNHYIQTINTSIGVYNKSTGARVAAFTFDTFMSQGNFGNMCDTDNFGDPVVLYDTFEDRWVITDFAFQVDGSGNVSPQIALQCFAVSKTGDPVSGGWNYYSINTTGGLGDYPKFGIWPDGIYMSANMFDYAAAGSFQNPRLYAFNKAQMYAGAPTVQTVQFDAPGTEFSLLPSNARLQAGTPPAGSPNYFSVVAQYLNVISVYKFKVDWNNISTSTFTGPFDSLNTTWWAQLAAANQTAPTTANRNDELYARLMMQNQYTNIGGVESLWNSMTAGLGNPTTNTTATQSAVRYYQLKVTGGTVESNTSQAFTYSPADTIWRYMPSLAVDRAGNMAIGYTTSNATTNPTLTYAGRLSTDALNSLPQTDQTMFAGTGSQSGNCGGSTCTRWGDYSAMSLDPDGCTFWYTNEYYQTTGLNHQTRIGSFKFSQCTVVGNGTVSGQVTASPGGAPISGATVSLGSRTTTTDASGNYSFNVPAGTYPGMTASLPGRTTATASNIVIANGGTTTQNFSLAASATSGCLTDTTQADFLRGVPTNTDLTTSSGNITLAAPVVIDKQTTNYTTAGFGFTSTSFAGETFTPTSTGTLQKIDINIFCSACSGTNPNIVVDVRTTSAGNIVMTAGGLLATVSIPGTSSASGGFLTATFPTPPTLTGGTVYGFVIKLASNRTTGTQAYLVSDGEGVTGGRRQTCTSSACSNATGQSNDIVFKSYMNFGFSTSGDFVSGAKDANPATGATPTWGTLSWTNTVPAGTTLKFQAAASSNAAGVFNFVGPDGTANTFFTSGASLAQFNGFRFLKYKALLTGTTSATPTLNDATVCFANVAQAASVLTTSAATGTFGGTVNLSATLTDGTNGISGKSVSFTLNGNSVGSATTNASGVATLSNASLAGINAGSYPSGVGASFAGDASYSGSSNTNSLTVNKANQTITVNTHAPSSATYNSQFTVAATASSGLSVAYSSSGVCTNSGATFTMTSGTGTCSVRYDQAGNSNYNAATQVTESVTAQKASQTITVGTHAPSTATYNSQFTVAATASSSLAVSYSSSGVCTNSGATYTMTSGTGTCTVKYDQAGDSNYNAASQVTESVTAQKASQTITFGVLGDKTYGDPDFMVSATASSSLSVSFAASGQCTVTGNSVHLTGAGSCTITASQGGDSNYSAATDVARMFSIAKANQTITVNTHAPSSATYNSMFTVAATASSSLAVTYSSSGVCTNSGATFTMTSGTGTCTVKYDQAGDSNYNAATQVTESVTAQKASATLSLSALNQTYDGSPKSATVTTTPSGLSGVSVTYDGSATAPTNAGSYAVVASLNNADYTAPDANDTLNIAQATTSSGVSSNHNPSTPGQSVTFTATVTSSAGTPTGMVTFKDGTNTLGTDNLDGAGQATFMTSALSTGDHSITAVYGGATNFSGSTSSVLTQTVGGSNDPPTANNGAAATDRDSAVAIVLTGSDPNNDPLTFSIADAPQHGILLGNAPDLVYVPDENDTATSDSFTFTVNDGSATSGPATVNIDLSATPCAKVNVALASNGTTTTASSQYSPAYPVSSVIDGTRHGQNWGNGGGWNDATGNTYPDFVQLDFHVNQLVKEVDVYTLQDNYPAAGDPTTDTVFTAFGVTAFEVQYFDSATLSWVAVPNVSVSGNDRALRKVKFPAITTDKVRVVVNNALAGYSRITEVEAYSCNAAMVCAGRTNVALSSYGATASASTEYSPSYPVNAIIDGARSGQNWGNGGGWNDATVNAYPDSVEVNFNVQQPINEVNVYTLQDGFGSGDDPTETTSGAAYGIKDFSVQYWNGSTWISVPGGDVTGNDKALRRFTFGTITTNKIRVLVNDAHASYSRIVELEAFSCNPVVVPGPNSGTNVALGKTVMASSEFGPNFPATSVVDGDRKAVSWGNGGGWNDATFNNFPDDLEVDFGCGQTINEIGVYTLKDDYNNGVEPTADTTFTAYGITDFDVQQWDGSAWVTVPGGHVTGNDRVWRRFTLLTPITTDKIRVVVNNGLGNFSRIVEIEAYSASPTTCGSKPSKVFPGITAGQNPLTPALPAFGGTLFNPSHSRAAEFVTGTNSESKNTEWGRDTLFLPNLLGLISPGF
jgi:hypothetical protein